MSAGYAAFSTNLNITAKGTIKFDEACTTGNEWTYEYKDNTIYDFSAPCTGTYKLETWGAQGGGTTGGYGGYSTGNVTLPRNQQLYINIGGHGNLPSTPTGGQGGYNGGGAGGNSYNSSYLAGYGGGGATHIAKKSGLLSTLSTSLSDILIVSGGGGGIPGENLDKIIFYGASGGGFKGNDAFYTHSNNTTIYSYGATQTTGYAFGQGQAGRNSPEFSSLGAEGNGGAGGGLYGGFTSTKTGEFTYVSGSGGSGYIGNTLLTNKVMYCYNCDESTEESTKTISTTNVSETPISNYAKQGNGYAKITLVSRN